MAVRSLEGAHSSENYDQKQPFENWTFDVSGTEKAQ